MSHYLLAITMGNWDKIKNVDVGIKQDIDRHSKLDRKVKDITKVIKNPDEWNANIASRDRMDSLIERVEKLEGKVNGISYLVKQLLNKIK